MKVTNTTYHNMDWLVKTKSSTADTKRRVLPQKPKLNTKTTNYTIDTQKIKEKIAKELSKKLKEIVQKNYIVNISIHKKTGQYVIKIIDPQTKEIVREMPWEKFLDFVAYMIDSIQKEHVKHLQEEKKLEEEMLKKQEVYKVK